MLRHSGQVPCFPEQIFQATSISNFPFTNLPSPPPKRSCSIPYTSSLFFHHSIRAGTKSLLISQGTLDAVLIQTEPFLSAARLSARDHDVHQESRFAVREGELPLIYLLRPLVILEAGEIPADLARFHDGWLAVQDLNFLMQAVRGRL